MIGLTRLNGRAVIVNAELIETVESTPDTVVSLTSGKKLIVMESTPDVVDKVISYRRQTQALEPSGAALTGQQAARAPTQHED